MTESATERLHQNMRDMWNETSIPKLVNEAEKKQIIQEIMHDEVPLRKETLKEAE